MCFAIGTAHHAGFRFSPCRWNPLLGRQGITVNEVANSNAMAAVKFAPLRKMERVSATAAYEQEEDAAPRAHALATVFGESSGRSLTISRFETTACTIADRRKPRFSAHSISQNMRKAIQSAWPTL